MDILSNIHTLCQEKAGVMFGHLGEIQYDWYVELTHPLLGSVTSHTALGWALNLWAEDTNEFSYSQVHIFVYISVLNVNLIRFCNRHY